MLAKFLRKWFGSVRLFMTLLILFAGLIVVALDIYKSLRVSSQLYTYLTAIAGVVAVFVWKDTDRPAGYMPTAVGYKYDGEDGDA